jgi:prepilin-type processing-associated H-X9-DG protein
MKCPFCQSDNADGANFCIACGRALSEAPPTPRQVSFSVLPSTSGLAIASLVLGILSPFTLCLTGLVGIILGIVALVQIGQSQGRLRGSGMAIAGLIIPVAAFPIVAAVLFPVFAKARSKAQITTCMNHQRQLAIGLLSYAQDNDETFPLPEKWVEATNLAADPRVFNCPTNSHEGLPKDPDYGMNGLLYDVDPNSGTRVGAPLGNIRDPTTLPLLADGGDADHLLNSETNIEKRHQGKAIIAYTDGHVALQEPMHFPKKYTEF